MIVFLIIYHNLSDILRLVDQLEEECCVDFIYIVNNDELSYKDKFYQFKKVIFYDRCINSGYAGGNEFLFQSYINSNSSSDKVIVVMNSDVYFDSDALVKIKPQFDCNSECGQLYYKLRDSDSKSMTSLHLEGLLHKKRFENPNSLVESDYAAGSFFAIHPKVYRKLDFLFDNNYFLYWEEVDLSMRVRSLGFKIYCDTTITIFRKNNLIKTEINSIYFIVRNAFLITKTLKPSLANKATFFIKYFCISLKYSLLSASPVPIFNYFNGVYDGLSSRFGHKKSTKKS